MVFRKYCGICELSRRTKVASRFAMASIELCRFEHFPDIRRFQRPRKLVVLIMTRCVSFDGAHDLASSMNYSQNTSSTRKQVSCNLGRQRISPCMLDPRFTSWRVELVPKAELQKARARVFLRRYSATRPDSVLTCGDARRYVQTRSSLTFRVAKSK